MAEITNFISQIQAGEVTYDIAVAHGITFKYGSADANPVTWNGADDAPFVVTIPSVTDIIQSPVVFAGTVDSTGAVTYVSNIPATPTKGYLVYITEACTFGGQACEAGDMAVYDGTTWRVIQGENQVRLVGTPANNVITAALGKSATNVITVEGTTLALNVDLSDLRDNVKVSKNAQSELNVTNGKVTVSSMNIDLTQGDDSTVTVAETKSFNLPTALASGAVTINESVLTAGDFTFTSGVFPTISKNASAVTISASTGITIGKAGADGATGDYVTSVTAIQGVTLAAGTSSSNHLAYVASLASVSGTEFVSGIHAYTDADQGKTADLVIPGSITADSTNNTFVTGLVDANAAGDNALVSSITVGAVTVDANGTSFLAGLSKGGNAVVTSVSLGTAVKDTTAQWFYAGLGEGSDVVTDVTVGAVSLVDAASGAGADAMVSASVSNHVLSFNTAKFQTPVAISQVNSTITKGGFTKAGVSLSGFGSESDVFTKAGITQASTTIAYKSITTGAVNLTVGASTSYFFNKAEDHAYAAEMGYKLIQTTDASVSKNTPKLENTDITATIPADTVAVALNAGTLPTLTIGAATGTLTGSVPTALVSTPYEFSAVSASAATLTIPGAYSLVSVTEGGVAVGKAGEYSLTGGKITLAADTMVTDVYVDGTAVSKLS